MEAKALEMFLRVLELGSISSSAPIAGRLPTSPSIVDRLLTPASRCQQ